MDHKTNSWIAWLQIISLEDKIVNGKPSIETKAKRTCSVTSGELLL